MKQTAKKPDYRKIRNTVYNAYAKDGMQAAFKLAESYGCKYENCNACDCETPVINHNCLICGQTTTPINEGKQPVQGEGFTGGEWKVKDSMPSRLIIATGEGINENSIAAIYGNGMEGEINANARLIAEAKNMYYALKDICEYEERGRKRGEPRISDTYYSPVKAILNRINTK